MNYVCGTSRTGGTGYINSIRNLVLKDFLIKKYLCFLYYLCRMILIKKYPDFFDYLDLFSRS